MQQLSQRLQSVQYPEDYPKREQLEAAIAQGGVNLTGALDALEQLLTAERTASPSCNGPSTPRRRPC